MSQEANMSELRACRACLATDTKLFDLQEHGLAQAFTALTTIPVLLSDGLPQQICNICRARLLKYVAFRMQSHNVHVLMETAHMHHTLTTTYIQNIDKTYLSLPLGLTEILTVDIKPYNTQNKPSKSDKSVPTSECLDMQAVVTESVIKIEIDDVNDSTDYNNDEMLDKHDNTDVGKNSSNKNLINGNIISYKGMSFNFVDTIKITNEITKSNNNTLTNNTDAPNSNGIHALDFVKVEMHDNTETEHSKRTNKGKNNINSVTDNKIDKIDNTDHKTNRNEIHTLDYVKVEINGKSKTQHSKSTKRGVDDIIVTDNKIESKDKKINRRAKDKETKINDVEDIEDCKRSAEAINCKYIVYSIEEQIERVLARKESSNYKNARLNCEECFKGFIRESALNNHMVRHDPSTGSHICEVCRARFPGRAYLNNHMRRHRQAYICNECGQSLDSRGDAERHHKYHSGFRHQCKECGKSFGKMTTYLTHVRIVHAGKGTVCELCGDSFLGERGLKVHVQKSHREALGSRCETCGVQFQSAAALTRHTDGPCRPGHWTCAACGDNFENGDRLNEHFQEVHKNQKKVFECKECNKTFKYEIYLSHHWRLKHSSTSEHFAAARSGARASCTARASYTTLMCEVCGLHFKCAAKLQYHQRIHTGEKPYKCSECAKSFRLPISLKAHMRTHTGVRPYKCPYCPKAFKTVPNKIVHIRSHTKEKPYTCSACHKGFRTGCTLKEHVTTVHMGQASRQRDRHKKKTKK